MKWHYHMLSLSIYCILLFWMCSSPDPRNYSTLNQFGKRAIWALDLRHSQLVSSPWLNVFHTISHVRFTAWRTTSLRPIDKIGTNSWTFEMNMEPCGATADMTWSEKLPIHEMSTSVRNLRFPRPALSCWGLPQDFPAKFESCRKCC